MPHTNQEDPGLSKWQMLAWEKLEGPDKSNPTKIRRKKKNKKSFLSQLM